MPLILREEPLTAVAAQHGTPLYVYSGDRLKSNLDRLDKALRDNFLKYHICYALKANTNPHLIRFMKENLPNLGGDCSSPGELIAASQSGISTADCIFTGNYEAPDDLRAAFESKCTMNLDDETSLDRLLKIGIPERISFRVNPGFGKGTYEQITTAGTRAKFGIPKEKIVAAYSKAFEKGVKRFGLQCMAGSGVLDPGYFPVLIKAILDIAGEIESVISKQLEFISIGGGYGIPYRDEEEPLDLNHVFKSIADLFYKVYPNKHSAPELWVEPGKILVGDAGILVARVTGIKTSYKSFIGLDAGMETLMRPALYKAYHRIYKIGDPHGRPAGTFDFTGRICENTDRLGSDRPFPTTSEGDLIAIMDTGAYGFSMANQFNNRPRPAEVLLVGGTSTLIRRRETIGDLFSTCDIE